jgi:hypothetical protein
MAEALRGENGFYVKGRGWQGRLIARNFTRWRAIKPTPNAAASLR